MEFLKCPDVRWKGPEKRNKANVIATTAKHPDSRSQISRYGWMQPTHMRSVTFWGKFTSGSRISASRSDLLKLPIMRLNATLFLPLRTTRQGKRAWFWWAPSPLDFPPFPRLICVVAHLVWNASSLSCRFNTEWSVTVLAQVLRKTVVFLYSHFCKIAYQEQ